MDIWFVERELVLRTYTVAETLLITRRVKIIDKKEFAVAALNVDDKTFMIHVRTLAEPITMPIHPSCQAQVALLISEETGIPAEYSDFSNFFSSHSAAELPEQTRINDHRIDLLDDKQSPYSLIYSLRPLQLEMLKTYIEANLASCFIRPSKSSADALILYVWKKDGGLYLYIDYWGLNNLTIKNCYPLPLLSKLLDYLGHAKRFTKLNLTNAYYWIRIRKGNEWKTAFQT